MPVAEAGAAPPEESDLPAPAESDLSDGERAIVYQWLAGLFAREMSLETLSAYRAAEGVALLKQFGAMAALAPLVEQFQGLVASGQRVSAGDADLAGAYARLFLGVGGRRSAPPYESAYTSERGLLFQEASAESQDLLDELGLHVDESFPEPADHIAVQLSVMAELARRAEAAAGEPARTLWRARQRAFLEQRLLSWIEPFYESCDAADRSGFYATAARSLVDFLKADGRRLRDTA